LGFYENVFISHCLQGMLMQNLQIYGRKLKSAHNDMPSYFCLFHVSVTVSHQYVNKQQSITAHLKY